MTDLHTENARLRAALIDVTAPLFAAISLLSRGSKKAAPSDKMFDQMVADYETSAERARAILATPAPDAVQAATRADRLADAAKTLLSVDEYGSRKEVYAACEGRVKVYKFDAALTRLSNARAPSQENAHDDA